MRTFNGEFGNQYRVGQLLPDHAVALRRRAEARTAELGNSRRSSIISEAVEEVLQYAQLSVSSKEDPTITINRAKVFTPIKKR